MKSNTRRMSLFPERAAELIGVEWLGKNLIRQGTNEGMNEQRGRKKKGETGERAR